MRRMILMALAAVCLAPFSLAGPALAGEAVELDGSPVSHGATVTLGDLFPGATGAAAGVVVAHVQGIGLQTILSADTVQARAHAAGLDWSNARGLHQVIIASEPASETPRPTAAAHHRLAHGRSSQTLVYARSLMAGEIVGASDLQWSDEAVAASDSAGDPAAAIGKAARWALRAGAPVELRELNSPKVVHRNEAVDVAFDDDGVTLVLQAKAMSDAAVGEPVEVMNTQSKKIVEAVVSGPGRAVVGPQAEALKASAFDPSIHLASR